MHQECQHTVYNYLLHWRGARRRRTPLRIFGIALWSGNWSVFQQIVCLPKQVFAIVLETLVKHSHYKYSDHRTNQAHDTIEFPPGEEHSLIVAVVELQRNSVS